MPAVTSPGVESSPAAGIYVGMQYDVARSPFGDSDTVHNYLVAQYGSEAGYDDVKLTFNEYRQRIDACLSWAQEAGAERVVCLELAQAWLQAALAYTEGNKQLRRAD